MNDLFYAMAMGNLHRKTKEKISRGVQENIKLRGARVKMKEKIEVGDTVKLRDDLTWKEIKENPIMVEDCIDYFLNNPMTKVESSDEYGFILVEEEKEGWLWPASWFVIVEKAPKTLYLDVRKTDLFLSGEITTDGLYVKSHGKEESDCPKAIVSWSREAFATEKPAPLEIIDGVVK